LTPAVIHGFFGMRIMFALFHNRRADPGRRGDEWHWSTKEV